MFSILLTSVHFKSFHYKIFFPLQTNSNKKDLSLLLTLNTTFSPHKFLFCRLPCHQCSVSLLLFQRIRSGHVHKDRAYVLLLKEMSHSWTPEAIPVPVAHVTYLHTFSDLQDYLLNFFTVEFKHILEAVFASCLT